MKRIMFLHLLFHKICFFFILTLFCLLGLRVDCNQQDEVVTGLVRIGTDYGGWTVPRDVITEDSICYCVGAGEDLSFDFGLIEHFNASVYSFDPTPRSIAHVQTVADKIKRGQKAYCNNSSVAYTITPDELDRFSFYPIGLWEEDSTIKFYVPKNPRYVSHSALNLKGTKDYFEAPCKKLSSIMNELGHDSIDLLKMDIEGAEYCVLTNMLEERIFPEILCIEFHTVKDYKQKILQKLAHVGYNVLSSHNGTDYTFLLDDVEPQEYLVKSRRIDTDIKMKCYEYFTDIFKPGRISTEYNAYQLLKHDPIDKEVIYVAVPWAQLINRGQLAKVPKNPLDNKGGSFTICQHIFYEKIIPILKVMGIKTLFTPHAIKNKKYGGITVLPFPHYAVNGVDPAENKDIWCSFLGYDTHFTRAKLFQLPKPKDVIIKKRSRWHFTQPTKQKEQEKEEYKNVLARSRFSICPRGTGASTIRFWESLQAGAIPVLISDAMSLPDWYDWNNCIVRVAEKDITKIYQILSKISKEQEELMRKNCLECYKLFSEDNFVSTIRLYYERELC